MWLKLSDDEFLKLRARNLALGEIMHNTRFGECEDIRFDLRHSEINPSEWIMDHLGGDDGRRPPYQPANLPFIWFPWYGKFDPDSMRAQVTQEFSDYENGWSPTPREVFGNITDDAYENIIQAERKAKEEEPPLEQLINEEIARRTPEATAKPGDLISIHRVIKYINTEDKFPSIYDRVGSIHVFVKISNSSWLYKLLDNLL
jgi:hypothetical protein